ncbi:MAG: hypothetical protein HN368_14860, partial [Spirochaetales bacterium]|nr:hypothetical protein [Spirochaetales bacterium]
EAVANYLMQHGWQPETPPVLRGRGGDEPVTQDPALQHENRRVVIEGSRTAAP